MDAVDQDLLLRLLDEHGAALVLYAQQWCRGPEDVVQEAFVRLMGQRPAPENAVGWLYRVVRNEAISLARAAGTRARHEAAAACERESWFATTPEDAVDAKTATIALQTLSIEEREVLVLRLWSELTFEQIAELTGKSTSTAHRRYEMGLANLREIWSITCPD